MTEFSSQIEWLIAKEKIRDVVAKYARGGDKYNDPEIFKDLFTEDAVWECEGFGRFEGKDQILSELARIGREEIVWSLHFPVSPLIEISDDRKSAHGFWWLWELLTIRENDIEKNKWLGANYDCDFVREADGWKMKHLILNIHKLVDSMEEAINSSVNKERE